MKLLPRSPTHATVASNPLPAVMGLVTLALLLGRMVVKDYQPG
jgi:hypothetical protein